MASATQVSVPYISVTYLQAEQVKFLAYVPVAPASSVVQNVEESMG